MTDDPQDRARVLADRLKEEGQHAHASVIAETLATKTEHGLFAALREVCETLLTALEALDPKTRLMAEELRLEVEKTAEDLVVAEVAGKPENNQHENDEAEDAAEAAAAILAMGIIAAAAAEQDDQHDDDQKQ